LYGLLRGKLVPSPSKHSREGAKTANNTLSYLLKRALSGRGDRHRKRRAACSRPSRRRAGASKHLGLHRVSQSARRRNRQGLDPD